MEGLRARGFVCWVRGCRRASCIGGKKWIIRVDPRLRNELYMDRTLGFISFYMVTMHVVNYEFMD